MFYKLLCIYACLAFYQLLPMESNSILEQYKNPDALYTRALLKDTRLQNKLDNLIIPSGSKVLKYSFLPEYYIKSGINRILGADRINQCIERCNLAYCAVARKYLYHVPGKPQNFDNKNYFVLAKTVHEDEDTAFTLPMVRDILTVFKETGFNDIFDNNNIIKSYNTAFFVDTDLNGFNALLISNMYPRILQEFVDNYTMTPEGRDYIEREISHCEKK